MFTYTLPIFCRISDESALILNFLRNWRLRVKLLVLLFCRQELRIFLARLSDDPCKALKQVTTGLSKWSERFMGDCDSQKNKQHIPKVILFNINF